ncbi:hypothetical protein [Bradyrhizobium sp. Leo121]|uniref:hypothetical protein n=1 Tax=Bradyrhizobium sp. Leo121 TaxID=1571195 RepID=UPI001028DCB4|nr:hypothetical protein [Bradyrhizobium sp. Leo121]RZN19491.1 hypothetical protein CWO90_35260 [Bradyrhizobium sp. Leo121]
MASIYIVICGTKEPYVAERDLNDMGREETIRDLARGEWGNILTGERCSVSSIIEVGTDKDVTAEFIAAAQMQMDSCRTPYSKADAAAWANDRRRAIEMAE